LLQHLILDRGTCFLFFKANKQSKWKSKNKKPCIKSFFELGTGLTPVILATQEAEIRWIAVQSQLGQIVCETLSRRNPSPKKDWWSGSRCRPWVQIPVLKKNTSSDNML
jgi:hypothetical protein